MGTFSEALSGLRSDVRELRREVREDVSDLRDEMRTELHALRSEVGALKADKTRAKGWIAGALAVASFLGTLAHWLVPCAIAALLVGCSLGPNGADSYWHDRWRPVPVLVDASMRPDCVQAAREGVEFWRDLGAPLRAAEVTTDRSVFSKGTLGAIVITERTLALNVRGATECTELETRIRSAVVRLARDEECHWAVVAHELGHAQGLEHADEPYMLMYPWGPGGDALSRAEIEWVRQ